jgi:hypothetical protein
MSGRRSVDHALQSLVALRNVPDRLCVTSKEAA